MQKYTLVVDYISFLDDDRIVHIEKKSVSLKEIKKFLDIFDDSILHLEFHEED